MPQAGMLSCPHCGGDVDANAARCTYCSVMLLARACPRCTARVFVGHKHCPNCGAATDMVRGTKDSPRVCPRCVRGLEVRMVEDLALDECPGCVGVFLDRVAIERLLADRHQARAESVVGLYRATPRRPDTTGKPGGKLYIKCPECSTIMNRKLFARGASVIVDVCRGHGTWFDAGELPAVVDFVMNGGLEAAEKKEIADQREQARRMMNEAHAHAHGSGLSAPVQTRGESGMALVDLLFSLWK